ncbi:3-dehydroquinate dehydratase [Virgibacillus pantothenticus]|uniref:3-dehydroquinate dehydratase n=1 Tax=Virgibacillus pantothenticus TaxID=1473 RepID=A0A0L0QML3_VIRPA|nr:MULTISPECIES: type I 3-dehydroquinate dehydratase [Virgibacillus]API93509.1 3-dehydroquinate dehydratase [Virgibacillus sp. 6R]KNE19806.1 3-dehydroquinate dehydratase [Virgibacillus pantothenticus]MBS7430105.1 type I 3-dehydroquinate dehydratase [Virgibacillus sp. 19R1-5]MBU8566317.1 type I 3-dehydroquinate dehydratase [Virgibacillus pantothenticus]MBU8600740.1 type I 3-dehydroquinate dehydratase [Virgibacillus pantothenticus]
METVTVKDVHIGEGMPKIIVPIMGATLQEIKQEITEAKREKPDMMEWRADALSAGDNLEEILRVLAQIRPLIEDVPLLFTFRTYKEGGQKEVTLEYYDQLLNQAIESGLIDLIDIEFFTEKKIRDKLVRQASKRHVMVILSNHDFQTTPTNDDMLSRLKGMQDAGADIAKLAVMPRDAEDVLRLLQVAAKMKATYAQKPFITIAMGPLGILSRIGGELVGSAASFGSGMQASAPGQLSATELKNLLQMMHRYLQK